MRRPRAKDRIQVSSVRRARGVPFGGLTIRALSAGLQIPGTSVAHVHLPPHYEHVPLFHKKTREWMVILRGTGKGKVGKRIVRFKPGTTLYMPPGTVHQMGTGASSMDVLVLFSPPMDIRDKKIDICYPPLRKPGH